MQIQRKLVLQRLWRPLKKLLITMIHPQVVESQKIKDSFDQYELTLYEKVNLIIN